MRARDGGFESEAHRVDVNDPVYLERMEMANDLCSWLKRYLLLMFTKKWSE